jgi:hypothetical protein
VTINPRRFGSKNKALIYAIIATCIAVCFGGIIPLAFTATAILLLMKAREMENSGEEEQAKQYHKHSLILSTVGIAASLVSITVVGLYLYWLCV